MGELKITEVMMPGNRLRLEKKWSHLLSYINSSKYKLYI